LNKCQKREVVSFLKQRLTECGPFVLVSFNCLQGVEAWGMRKAIEQSGSSMVVAKNSLIKIALKGDFDGVVPYVSGPTAIVYGGEITSICSSLIAFRDQVGCEKIDCKVGFFAGEIISSEGVEKIAKLPSLDVLRAKLLGLLTSAPSKLLRVMKEPSSSLVRVLDAFSKKDE
jgi:large subunit ribosomal protein L10